MKLYDSSVYDGWLMMPDYGFSAFFPGFLFTIFYVYNHEGLRTEPSEQDED